MSNFSDSDFLDELKNRLDKVSETTGTLGRYMDKFGSSAKGASDATDKLKKDLYGVSKETKKLRSGVDNTAKTLEKLTRGADGVTEVFTSFATKLLGAGLVGYLAKSTHDYVETFRNLTDVGQSFGGNMIEMGKQAALAGLPLDDFAKQATKSSKLFSELNGKNGFFGLALDVRRISEQFGMFGMTTEELNETLGDYLEANRLYGQLDNFNRQRNIKGFAELIETTSALSAAFGTSRRETLKAVNESRQDTLVASRLSRLNANSQEEYSQVLSKAISFMAAQPGVAGDIFTKMLTQSFGAGTALFADETKMFVDAGFGQAVGLFEDLRTKIENQSFSDADALDFFKEFRDQGEMARENLELQAIAGNANAKQVLEVLNQMKDVTQEEFLQAKREAKSQEGLTRFFNSIGSILNRIVRGFRSGIYDALIKISDRLDNFLNGKGFEDFINGIEETGKKFGIFLNEKVFSEENIKGFTDRVSEFFDFFYDIVTSDTLGKIFNSINSFAKEIFNDENREVIKSFFESTMMLLKKFTSFISALGFGSENNLILNDRTDNGEMKRRSWVDNDAVNSALEFRKYFNMDNIKTSLTVAAGILALPFIPVLLSIGTGILGLFGGLMRFIPSLIPLLTPLVIGFAGYKIGEIVWPYALKQLIVLTNKETWTNVGDLIYQQVIDPIGNFFTSIPGRIADGFDGIWSGIKNTLDRIIQNFPWLNSLVNFASNPIGTTIDAGKNLFNDLFGGNEGIPSINIPTTITPSATARIIDATGQISAPINAVSDNLANELRKNNALMQEQISLMKESNDQIKEHPRRIAREHARFSE